MRRADRLFQIVQHLRLRKTRTAARELARRQNVSERTIYRDVQDLVRSGVPIEGEAGVGYVLRGFDVPPLMFTREEIEALVVGARMVETWTTEPLALAARQALAKIEAALPERLKGEIGMSRIYAVDNRTTPELRARLDVVRQAVIVSRSILSTPQSREPRHATLCSPLACIFGATSGRWWRDACCEMISGISARIA